MGSQAWKTSERRIASKLQRAAGVVRDPVLKQLVTVTGRVGHLVTLGFDILVGNADDGTALVGEAKRRKAFLTAEAQRALLQIFRIGQEYNRTPVLGFTLTEDVPDYIETNQGKRRIERDWLILPLPFAAELLRYRRAVEEASRDNPAIAEALEWYLRSAPDKEGLLVAKED